MWNSLPLHEVKINVESWDVGSRAWKVVTVRENVCLGILRQSPMAPRPCPLCRPRESPPLIQQHIQMHIDSAVHQLSLLRLPSLFTSGNHDTHQQTRHQSQAPDSWSTWWHRPKTKIYPRKESQAKHAYSGRVDKSRRKFAYSPDPSLPVCFSAVSSLVLHFPEPAFP